MCHIRGPHRILEPWERPDVQQYSACRMVIRRTLRWCGYGLSPHLAASSVSSGHTEAVIHDGFLKSEDTYT